VRGDKVAIVGANRPKLYWSMMAAQMLGAVPVPVYSDAIADELAYVLDHAEVRFAAVQDQEQVDKLLSVSERVPRLKTMLYDWGRGLRDYDHTHLHPIEAVIAQGRARLSEGPDVGAALDAEIDSGTGDDLSIILYTSGTTGRSKGVMLSRRAARSRQPPTRSPSTTCPMQDEVLAYLPLAWVGDHYLNFAQGLVAGFCTACPESADRAGRPQGDRADLLFRAAARVREPADARDDPDGGCQQPQAPDVPSLHRGRQAMGRENPQRAGSAAVARACPTGLAILVYAPLKNALGFSKVRTAYTAGEAIGPELFSFYRSLGMNLKQLYGQTEAFLYVTAQPDGQIRADTVGPATPNVEIRIEDGTGEVLYKSPGQFVGYFKDAEKTAETMTPRWLRAHRRCRLLRGRHWPSQDHRSGQGCLEAEVRLTCSRRNTSRTAEVLSEHQGGGGVRPGRGFRHGVHQHRSDRRRQLGRAQQRGLWLLSGTGRQPGRLFHHRLPTWTIVNAQLARRAGDGGGADPALPDPAQGAGCR
jgi:long-chain acyl-CoA synthetase